MSATSTENNVIRVYPPELRPVKRKTLSGSSVKNSEHSINAVLMLYYIKGQDWPVLSSWVNSSHYDIPVDRLLLHTYSRSTIDVILCLRLWSEPAVHWNISNGRSKLNCTIVLLTVTDSWPPALKILPSEWLLVRYQPYNNNNNNNKYDFNCLFLTLGIYTTEGEKIIIIIIIIGRQSTSTCRTHLTYRQTVFTAW